MTPIKTHFIWIEEIPVNRFKVEDLDINKPVLHMVYEPQEKDIICAPKEYKKRHLKMKELDIYNRY